MRQEAAWAVEAMEPKVSRNEYDVGATAAFLSAADAIRSIK